MPSSSVSYRTLFSLPGGTFVAVSALARLPLAMSQLGTLLLVSSPQVSGGWAPVVWLPAWSPWLSLLVPRFLVL